MFTREFFWYPGECWSGENLDITYSKDDSSEFCISKEFAECDTNDRNVCGGNATTTYIYRMPKESEAKQGKCATHRIFTTNIKDILFLELSYPWDLSKVNNM